MRETVYGREMRCTTDGRERKQQEERHVCACARIKIASDLRTRSEKISLEYTLTERK